MISPFTSLLRRRQITGPEPCALATAHILLHVVAKSKWSSVDQLLDHIQTVGRRLVIAQPQELVIGNIVRRVLYLVRSEAEEERNHLHDGTSASVSEVPSPDQTASPPSMAAAAAGAPAVRPPPRLLSLTSTGSFHVPQSMFNMLYDSPKNGSPFFGRSTGASTPMSHANALSNISALRSEVINGIEEIKDEITSVDEEIASYADVQIHPGSFVLAYRPSATLEKFLLAAAKRRRRFTVLIAGVNPPNPWSHNDDDDGREPPYEALRAQLAKFGVETIVIAGSGLMGYMPRVNVVLLEARAITANGAVVAGPGTAMAARAAHEFNKTVLVLGGVYKICPEDEPDLDAMVEVYNPSGWVGYDGQMVEVNVDATSAEYITPELVDIYITNL